ncbi:MAG: hypothetical protein HYS12_17460 [Planctomycetes bacterium]|nr:hypothetical protein [Planctomycetota bacterium]
MMSILPVDLPVIARAYDFLIWTAKHVARFPRAHRFNVGERMERHLYGILEGLLRAKFTRERVPLLRQVNLDLEVLRFQFRAAKDLKCLSLWKFAGKYSSYQAVCKKADRLEKMGYDTCIEKQGGYWCVYCR